MIMYATQTSIVEGIHVAEHDTKNA